MLAEVGQDAGSPAGVINVVTRAPGATGAIGMVFPTFNLGGNPITCPRDQKLFKIAIEGRVKVEVPKIADASIAHSLQVTTEPDRSRQRG